jgi:hypothetical protein
MCGIALPMRIGDFGSCQGSTKVKDKSPGGRIIIDVVVKPVVIESV